MRFFLTLTVLLGMTAAAFAEAEADLFVAFDNSYTDGVGGDENAKVLTANAVAASNVINAASGSPARMRVCGYHKTWWQANRSTLGGYVNWMNNYGDNELNDVTAAADAAGADIIAYICQGTDTGIAAVAQQPGRYGAYQPNSFWNNIVAHESGGHNYGLDHRVGRADPKTIMLHNYCGGGSQGYYSNPNIWLSGAKLLGEGSCLGDAVQGGDATYTISTAAQGVADRKERVVWGSYLGAITHRWQFNQAAGAAPAGTPISGTGGTAYVRGNGATFTGSALRLPGGTTGNTAGDSITAYIDMPNGMFSGMPNWTLEIWAAPLSGKTWMRVIDIGRTTEAGDGTGAAGEYTPTDSSPAPGATTGSDQIGLSATTGSGSLNNQRLITGVDGTYEVDDSNLGTTAGELHHYTITFANTSAGGTIKWYRDGVLIKTRSVTFHSADLEDVNNWLGRSLWSGDQMANMDYYDVRVQSLALNDNQVAANYRIGPNDSVVTLWANDSFGNSGFVNGSWESQTTPDSSHDYEIGELTLRTPANSSNNTFPGKSLAISGGGTLLLKGNAVTTTTVSDLRLAGGTILNGTGGNIAQTVAGNITMTKGTENYIRAANGPLTVSATISGGVGGGGMHYTENAVTLTGNNSGYLGATIIGDGRFSTLKISSETNLGGNPTFYGGAWLQLNRGILETTATMTIDDPNRGVLIGPSGGIFRPAAGTTLTIASTLNSPAAGNTLQTAPMFPNPVVGYLFKESAGTLVLTNPNNSYIGEMILSQGELRLDGAGRLNNGDMHMPITLNSTLNVNTTGDQIFGGVISGAGTFIKNNTGTTTFYAANTFSGSVTINGGTVYARANNAATNRNFSYVSGITVNNGATLRTQSNSLFGWDGTQEKPVTVNAGATLTADSGADVGLGTLTLAGGTLANLGASTAWGSWRFDEATDKLLVTQDSTVTATNVKFGNASAAIEVASGRTLNFTGTVTNATSGGTSYLRKTGTGTLILAGTNTYTGATAITNGTVFVNGSLASGSAVSVSSGARLAGTGTVGGSLGLAAGAIHAPGNSNGIGTQTVNGALSYANTSRLKWSLMTNSNSAGSASRVTAGAVNVTAGALVDLTFNTAGSTVNFFDTFWTQARSWTVVSSSGMTGTFALGTVTNDASGQAASNFGTFNLTQNAGGATLNWTPKAYTIWRGTSFGANAGNPAISDFSANPDFDKLGNGWEYFHGTNPSVSNASPFNGEPMGGRLTATFPRNTAATDLVVTVRGADSPAGPWTDLAQSTGGAPFTALVTGVPVSESGTGGMRDVQVGDQYMISDPSHPRRFLQLTIQQQ